MKCVVKMVKREGYARTHGSTRGEDCKCKSEELLPSITCMVINMVLYYKTNKMVVMVLHFQMRSEERGGQQPNLTGQPGGTVLSRAAGQPVDVAFGARELGEGTGHVKTGRGLPQNGRRSAEIGRRNRSAEQVCGKTSPSTKRGSPHLQRVGLPLRWKSKAKNTACCVLCGVECGVRMRWWCAPPSPPSRPCGFPFPARINKSPCIRIVPSQIHPHISSCSSYRSARARAAGDDAHSSGSGSYEYGALLVKQCRLLVVVIALVIWS